MRTSTVGLPRALARVRPPRIRPSLHGGNRRRLRAERLARAAIRPVRRSVGARIGAEAAVPAAVALILAIASVISWLPGIPARGAVAGAVAGSVGRPSVDGPSVDGGSLDGPSDVYAPLSPVARPSLPAAMAVLHAAAAADADDAKSAPAGSEAPPVPTAASSSPAVGSARQPPALDLRRIDPDAVAAARAAEASASQPAVTGPFLPDGTLVKPVAVDTTVADARHMLKTHRIAKGESLMTIAEQYNVSMMTIWWANDLRSHNLVVGKTLTIPPVDGLVVTVEEGDTLASLAKAHDVDAAGIEEVNELDDPVLVAGQTLVLPGAAGEPIPEPTRPPPGQGTAGPAPGGEAASPAAGATYDGGRMTWPVIGGNQFVSRGFAGYHQGLDVASDHGARVVAAAGGIVIFAGWKPNGGGYQVWIAHGSGIHTTYSHLSAVSVGNGQAVGAGQMVGRVGDSGYSTGPHLHFEVWHGAIWAGGARVNPMSHL